MIVIKHVESNGFLLGGEKPVIVRRMKDATQFDSQEEAECELTWHMQHSFPLLPVGTFRIEQV